MGCFSSRPRPEHHSVSFLFLDVLSSTIQSISGAPTAEARESHVRQFLASPVVESFRLLHFDQADADTHATDILEDIQWLLISYLQATDRMQGLQRQVQNVSSQSSAHYHQQQAHHQQEMAGLQFKLSQQAQRIHDLECQLMEARKSHNMSTLSMAPPASPSPHGITPSSSKPSFSSISPGAAATPNTSSSSSSSLLRTQQSQLAGSSATAIAHASMWPAQFPTFREMRQLCAEWAQTDIPHLYAALGALHPAMTPPIVVHTVKCLLRSLRRSVLEHLRAQRSVLAESLGYRKRSTRTGSSKAINTSPSQNSVVDGDGVQMDPAEDKEWLASFDVMMVHSYRTHFATICEQHGSSVLSAWRSQLESGDSTFLDALEEGFGPHLKTIRELSRSSSAVNFDDLVLLIVTRVMEMVDGERDVDVHSAANVFPTWISICLWTAVSGMHSTFEWGELDGNYVDLAAAASEEQYMFCPVPWAAALRASSKKAAAQQQLQQQQSAKDLIMDAAAEKALRAPVGSGLAISVLPRIAISDPSCGTLLPRVMSIF